MVKEQDKTFSKEYLLASITKEEGALNDEVETFQQSLGEFEGDGAEEGDPFQSFVTLGLLGVEEAKFSRQKVLLLLGKAEKIATSEWLVANPIQQTERISTIIPPTLQSTISRLAASIKTEPNAVLEAAIQTHVLMGSIRENGPTFLRLGGGPEGIKLTHKLAQIITPDGKLEPVATGYVLEYYTLFIAMVKGAPIPLYLRMSHSEPESLDFDHVFPRVLFFAKHVRKKKQQDVTPASNQETESPQEIS
ncbi:hypothetical protein HY439_01765 [Candidatus Microgenomates bacterium]|nr:hypothetical protein [Candidatus Microgenomates bacterium]